MHVLHDLDVQLAAIDNERELAVDDERTGRPTEVSGDCSLPWPCHPLPKMRGKQAELDGEEHARPGTRQRRSWPAEVFPAAAARHGCEALEDLHFSRSPAAWSISRSTAAARHKDGGEEDRGT